MTDRDSFGGALGLLLVAILSVGALPAACDRPPVAPTPIEAASDALYTAEMQVCLDKGKAAHSRAAYRECAAGVDARWADGGAK